MSGKGKVVVAAVAALLTTAAPLASNAGAPKGKVRCAGVNSCKGKGACKSAKNGCKGHNSCKGKGWIYTTPKECKAKGGKVIK